MRVYTKEELAKKIAISPQEYKDDKDYWELRAQTVMDIYDKHFKDVDEIKKVIRRSRIAGYAYSDIMLRSKTAEEAADYYYSYIDDLATALAENPKKERYE